MITIFWARSPMSFWCPCWSHTNHIYMFFISAIGICRFLSSILLACIAALTHVVIFIRGLAFQVCAFIASIGGLYLVSFICMAYSTNMSFVKVNSRISMVRFGVGIMGSFCSYVAPCMYTMSGRSFARHSHHVLLHVHLSIHCGMVLSCWLPCCFPAFVSVKCLVCSFDFNKLLSWWVATLCLAILKPLRHLLFHKQSRCGHVSLSLLWHNVQLGLAYVCGPKKFFPWLPMYCAKPYTTQI